MDHLFERDFLYYLEEKKRKGEKKRKEKKTCFCKLDINN